MKIANSAARPWWQQVTALVSVGVGGTVTGFAFVPKAPPNAATPASLPLRLLAYQQRAGSPRSNDALLRAAIVNVARYYLRLAEHKSPAEMEALIWQRDSLDGVDHGESCAAFASLTLELGAQAVGQQSWVTGGSTYPWPLHSWADVRVDPNPASPSIVSVLQDAEAHHRWHPLGDGYRPLPGDWVLFSGHVEVVTGYSGGLLHTIGGDSLPNLSVNAHSFPEPLAAQGVTGFVNNGGLGPSTGAQATALSSAGHTSGLSSGTAAAPASGQGAGTGGNPRTGRPASADHGPAGAAHRAAKPADGAQVPGVPGQPPAGAGAAARPGQSADGAQVPGVPGQSPAGTAVAGGTGGSAGAEHRAGSSGSTPRVLAPSGRAGQRGGPPGVAARPSQDAGRAEIPGVPESGSSGSAGAPAHRNTGHPGLSSPRHTPAAQQAQPRTASARGSRPPGPAEALVPGIPPGGTPPRGAPARHATTPAGAEHHTRARAESSARIPGLPGAPPDDRSAAASRPAAPHRRHQPTGPAQFHHDLALAAMPASGTSFQQAFISKIAPAAMAAQRRYGVPASVTIAQAIDESGWGRSTLATHDHNLFGIKGSGPAGSTSLPTQEYENGQMVSQISPFRVYHSITESVDDHGRLLATSGYYQRAMANRGNPNAFAQALTGVYATDPQYGDKLIALMRQYNLYRYDNPVEPVSASHAATAAGVSIPGLPVAWSEAHNAAATPRRARASDLAPAPHSVPGDSSAAGSAADTVRQVPAQRRPAPPSPEPTPSGQPTHAESPAGVLIGEPTPFVRTARTPRRQPSPAATGAGRAGQPSAASPSGRQPRPGASPAPAIGPAVRGPSMRPMNPSSLGNHAGGVHPEHRSAAPGGTAAPADPDDLAPEGETEAVGATPLANREVAAPQPGTTPDAATSGRRAEHADTAGPGQAMTGTGQGRKTASRTATQPAGKRTAASSAGRAGAARPGRLRTVPYQQQIPQPVRHAFTSKARMPLLRSELLYRDVAEQSNIRWELLAACDWMQCQSRTRFSPVNGEKLGTVNPDGTVYRTKSEALAQCADDLAELALLVYNIDVTGARVLSIRELASAFAAFRWGGLLKQHRTSPLEFPYSIAGLTTEHIKMRWPAIDDPNAPDKPGSRFAMPFGAVPTVLLLNYPATTW
jgi:flagellum-specific peptidoglycan hydrolase FlgJ